MSKKEFNFGFGERRFAYDDKNGDIYKTLAQQPKSPFYRSEYTKIFMAAMIIGYKKNHHPKLTKRVPNIQGTVFSKEEKWLIISLYMKKNPELGVKALFEPNAIFDLAEEYANGGIEFLESIYKDSSEPIDELETEFRKYLKT